MTEEQLFQTCAYCSVSHRKLLRNPLSVSGSPLSMKSEEEGSVQDIGAGLDRRRDLQLVDDAVGVEVTEAHELRRVLLPCRALARRRRVHRAVAVA